MAQRRQVFLAGARVDRDHPLAATQQPAVEQLRDRGEAGSALRRELVVGEAPRAREFRRQPHRNGAAEPACGAEHKCDPILNT